MNRKHWIHLTSLCLLLMVFPLTTVFAQTGTNDACLSAAPNFTAGVRIGRGAINDFEVSPDSAQVAVASSQGVWIYDDNLSLITHLSLPDEAAPASSLSWSPDHSQVAAGYADGVRIWDVAAGKVVQFFSEIPDVTHVAWSPDGMMLAVLNTGFIAQGMNNTIYSDLRIINIFTNQVETRLTDLIGNTNQAAWSPDSTRLLYLVSYPYELSDPGVDSPATVAGQAMIWFADGSQPIYALTPADPQNPLSVKSASWSPDGTQIALDVEMGETRELQIRDAASSAVLQKLAPGDNPQWSDDGSHFAAYQNYDDPAIHIRDGKLTTEQQVMNIQAEQFRFSPDGSRFYAYDSSLVLNAYDTTAWTVTASLNLHPYQLLEAAWSPDGATLAARYGNDSAGNATVFLWSAAGELLQRITTTGTLNSLYWSPDSDRLVIAKYDGIEIWDLKAGTPLVIATKRPFRLAWSPDGTKLAAILESGDVDIWDSQTGEALNHVASPVENLSGTSNYLDSRIVWPESGLRWLIRDWDDIVRVYSPDQDKRVADLGAPDFNISGGVPSFTPDGLLYYTLQDNQTYLYDPTSGKITRQYSLQGQLSQIGFSNSLACYAMPVDVQSSTPGLWNTSLQLLSLESNSTLNTLLLPLTVETTYRSGAVAWSPDGKRLAILLADGSILVWGLPAGRA